LTLVIKDIVAVFKLKVVYFFIDKIGVSCKEIISHVVLYFLCFIEIQLRFQTNLKNIKITNSIALIFRIFNLLKI
jgi:hypothetical protein